MSIIFRDVYNDFSPITHNGTILPYGITEPALRFTDEEPVSPPHSPTPEGEDCIQIGRIYHGNFNVLLCFYPFVSNQEMKQRQGKYPSPRTPNNKKMTKNMRRMGKLKQPGGASCNQRR